MNVQAIDSDKVVDKTLADVLAWAALASEPYAAICELRKIPARLGMIDDDITLIPADIGYFETQIAPSGYGVVSKAGDLKAARQRGNARVRALLRRFHAALVPGAQGKHGRDDWDRLIGFVKGREGFTEKGALLSTGTSRSLVMLKARIRVAPRDITAAEIDRVAVELSAEKRKTLRRSLVTFNWLFEKRIHFPELVDLLPDAPVSLPEPISTVKRIFWASLPDAFRFDAEAIMTRALARPEDRMDDARARIAAGENAELVLRDLDEQANGRKRPPGNSTSAIAGWRGAITWLIRAAESCGLPREDLKRLDSLFTSNILESACAGQVARSLASKHLKDPAKTQTLKARLTALETLARHGLKRPDLVSIVELQNRFYSNFVRRPGEAMTDDVRQLCDALIRTPALAASFVNAPLEIASRANEQITHAKTEGNIQKELSGLRLYATAVLFAVQVSRPVRTSNLIRLRFRGTPDAPGHITWIQKRTHAELRFPPGEIKNDREVSVHVLGDEALILWTWLKDLRSQYLTLRGLSDTPYVLPGDARPRMVKSGMDLPPGCIAPSTLSEIWRDGADIIGLDLTPHQARHAVATLILAVEPGNFAKAAAVLGDTEDTVRKHYGRDSGAEAARQVRAALKSRHPGIFRAMKKRLAS